MFYHLPSKSVFQVSPFQSYRWPLPFSILIPVRRSQFISYPYTSNQGCPISALLNELLLINWKLSSETNDFLSRPCGPIKRSSEIRTGNYGVWFAKRLNLLSQCEEPRLGVIWCRLADPSLKVCYFPLSSCLFQAFPGDGVWQLFYSVYKIISQVLSRKEEENKSLSSLVLYSLVSSRISWRWQRSL